MQSVKKLKNLKGKKVILRVDFNVPIKNGRIEDDFRIKKSLPTIKYLLERGANILLITHLGKDGSESLAPVEKHFFKLSKAPKSRVEFFDNIRKYSGEESNDPKFARELAALGDIYVNDAFSVSHRTHASVVGIPKYLPSYAGLQLEEEIKNLSVPFKKPKRPFLFILGGAKFSTKAPLIKKYLRSADYVFIGGALLNDFLKAKGFEVGKSLTDDRDYGLGKIVNNKKIILATDVLVERAGKALNVAVSDVGKGDTIIDIGRESTETLSEYAKRAKLILWNGPLGRYESGGAKATRAVLRAVAKSQAQSFIGGGDTVALISEMKMEKKFTFVSTGGGATLDFLSAGTLPGIKALR